MAIFLEGQFMCLAKRNMESYMAGVGIKRVQTFAICDPKDSLSVLATRLDIIATEAQPIPCVVTEPSGVSRVGI